MLNYKLINNTIGIVLTETLIAITTLAAGVIALGTITTTSISTTILSRDYLVARGLVTEGVEIVKSIPKTNWLKCPSNKEAWLMIGGTCKFPTSPVANSNYIPAFANGSWVLSNMGNKDLNLDASPPGVYQLYLSANQQYVYDNGVSKSQFSRSVKFISVDIGSATFEVKVQWNDGAKTREILEEVSLSNSI